MNGESIAIAKQSIRSLDTSVAETLAHAALDLHSVEDVIELARTFVDNGNIY